MVKGRKPLATEVKRLSGAFKKDPKRENKHEPIAREGMPSKPAHIAANALASGYWDHVCSQLSDMNLLTKADRSLIEVFSECMAQRQTAFIAGDIKAQLQCAAQCRLYIAELGLSPSSRSRLIAKTPEEDNAFAQWQKGFGLSDN